MSTYKNAECNQSGKYRVYNYGTPPRVWVAIRQEVQELLDLGVHISDDRFQQIIQQPLEEDTVMIIRDFKNNCQEVLAGDLTYDKIAQPHQ